MAKILRMHPVTDELAALRKRAGYKKGEFALLLGYSFPSGYQRYENSSEYTKHDLSFDLVKKMAPHLIGKGDPPISVEEVYDLAGLTELDLVIAAGVDKEVGAQVHGFATTQTPSQAPSTLDSLKTNSGPYRGVAAPYPKGDTQPVPLRSRASASGDEGAIIVTSTEVFDWKACPPGLAGVKDLYCIEVVGDCMKPMLRDGDPVFTAGHKITARAEDLIVFEVQKSQDADKLAYIKEFVSKSDDTLTVRQYHPAQELTYPMEQVNFVNRVFNRQEENSS